MWPELSKLSLNWYVMRFCTEKTVRTIFSIVQVWNYAYLSYQSYLCDYVITSFSSSNFWHFHGKTKVRQYTSDVWTDQYVLTAYITVNKTWFTFIVIWKKKNSENVMINMLGYCKKGLKEMTSHMVVRRGRNKPGKQKDSKLDLPQIKPET